MLDIVVPKGIRTPVAAVKGQCPRPLDDGDEANSLRMSSGHSRLPGRRAMVGVPGARRHGWLVRADRGFRESWWS